MGLNFQGVNLVTNVSYSSLAYKFIFVTEFSEATMYSGLCTVVEGEISHISA